MTKRRIGNDGEPVTSLTMLLSYKAICLMSGLSTAERRVLAAIIDHYNRTDGQCDPSIDRLKRLLGLHRRTVLRAVKRLVRLKLIRRVRNGGKSQRNSYEPNWPFFNRLETDWSASKKRGAEVANLSADRWRGCHQTGGEPATQTNLRNLSSKPVCHHRDRNDEFDRGNERADKGQAKKGVVSSGPVARHQRPHREPAEAAKCRRWDADVRDYFGSDVDAYAAVVELIDIYVQEAATDAEMKRQGGGLKVILDHIRKIRPEVVSGRRHDVVDDGGDGSSQGAAPLAVSSDPDIAPVRLAETRVDMVDAVDAEPDGAGEDVRRFARTSAKNLDLTKPDIPDSPEGNVR